uniref:uncharacterized protein n=1 Tax=Myxine glutinosa TaxID=7769 RepID=UPI00358E7DDF
MNSHGITKIKPSTKKHVRRKLESELEGSLHFVSNEKGRVLLYPDSLSMDDLVKEAHNMKQDLREAQSIKSMDVLTKAAIQLRNQIKKQDVQQSWPPDTQKSVIPEAVTKFLYTLLTGDTECANPSERVQRLAASFGSDLVFAVTCGKTKPPKHILLPFAVKSLTGNTELIRSLNRLGHAISYSQVEEIDTALCVQKLERSAEDIPLPEDMHPGGFSVQIGCKNPFGWIPVDQTIEETVNKDTQTPGGTKGFSLKPGAVARYYLTSEYRSTYMRQLRDMVHVGQHDNFSHPDLQMPRIRRDEADIQSMVPLMETSWLNPFNLDHGEFVSLSTGAVAPA